MSSTPEPTAVEPAPDRWLLRRAGYGAVEVSSAEAEMIARRPDTVDDGKGGLIWQEPDADSYGGFTIVMLTPDWGPR